MSKKQAFASRLYRQTNYFQLSGFSLFIYLIAFFKLIFLNFWGHGKLAPLSNVSVFRRSLNSVQLVELF